MHCQLVAPKECSWSAMVDMDRSFLNIKDRWDNQCSTTWLLMMRLLIKSVTSNEFHFLMKETPSVSLLKSLYPIRRLDVGEHGASNCIMYFVNENWHHLKKLRWGVQYKQMFQGKPIFVQYWFQHHNIQNDFSFIKIIFSKDMV